ncbi:hypothetical protein CSOJ01_11165 [Colletotrichum sojae]|uniref:NWD NACHT-NTPase N-terminal domain-containing protein n=1 Tax=Colletotrichum sojae TaxID=2175907 RepID=A0A8H6MP24_9PEZI|nr:hypothetical protein CSOJ01_11165 [Colletotrichum sojae]
MATTGPGSGGQLPLRPGGSTTNSATPVGPPTPQPGGPTISPAPKRAEYWELVFQRLSDKDKELIEEMKTEQSVQSFISGTSPPTSAPKLEQLIKSAVGDTAVQYDPASAALPWAAVRFFIQVAVSEKEQMHHLLAVVEIVTRITSRCRVYELVYPPESLVPDCATSLQKALVNLYGAVFRAIADSYKLFARNTAMRTLHAMVNPQKTQEMMKEIDDREVALQKVTATCEAMRIANIDSTSTELVQLLERFEAPLARVNSRVAEHMERLDEGERRNLLEWISPVLYGSHHEQVRDLRTPDTCDWLLRNARFKDWYSSSTSACLLLYGIRDRLESRSSDEAFAFFYCKRDFEDRSDPVQVLKSYISATDDQDDIAKFVNTKITKHPRWSRMAPQLQQEIRSTLLLKSNGMFQWAALQVKQLLDLTTTAAIKDRLGKLPETLKDAYNEIYAKINALHSEDRKLATRAFQWVMCSRRPLTTEELVGAILVDLNRDDTSVESLQVPEIGETETLALTQNLLVLHEAPFEWVKKIWSFPHLSVVEYLEESHLDLPEAHYMAACATLKIMKILFRGYFYENVQVRGGGMFLKLSTRATSESSRYFAATCYLSFIIRIKAVKLTTPGSFGAPAISRSSLPLRILLGHASEVHINGPYTPLWPGPLAGAVCYGTHEAVQLLMDKGAKPNLTETETERYKSETLLALAADRSDLETVKLLIQGGADVNAYEAMNAEVLWPQPRLPRFKSS